jgi:tRNA-specific 2-thiouridylase
MADERFEEYLRTARGHQPDGAFSGAAGGAACGDLVRVSVLVRGDRVADAGCDASGCGAAQAAASAAVELVRGATVIDAARVSAAAIADELGGLSPGKLHAAELAADALHRALGAAVRADGAAAIVPGRLLVAMSGGVDSAVVALRGGPDAVAVTLELWSSPENDAQRSCCSADAVRHARALAHRMGLAHFTLDLREEFRAGVVEPWLADHEAGLTPNPCVRCNGSVRLDAMLGFADRIGAPALATGHYARVSPDGLLRAAVDATKDQSYVLAALPREALARMRFPLGELTKVEVRALAHEAQLSVAKKPDSQDLCFLAGTGRAAFLARHGGMEARPGPIVDTTGARVGTHAGHADYTIGQRKGLGIGGGVPRYVVGKDAATNVVVVGDRADLATRRVALRDVHLHRPAEQVRTVRLRYRARPVACRLDGDAVELEEPFDGVAPGQAAVLMSGDVVLGHATIA